MSDERPSRSQQRSDREQQFSILPARPSDLRAVYRIAQLSFPIPWPLEELRRELTRPFSELRVLRADERSGVVAFLNHWRVADEFQIMNVAVDPAQRRRGFGSALLADLLQLARAQTISAVTLEVRRSNTGAIRLYERHGFRHVGVRPRYYSDNQEDALVMSLGLVRQ
jgi:[ribosomal protein S18]-alanine N-acetyltransferase